jgi:hypothetical protein
VNRDEARAKAKGDVAAFGPYDPPPPDCEERWLFAQAFLDLDASHTALEAERETRRARNEQLLAWLMADSDDNPRKAEVTAVTHAKTGARTVDVELLDCECSEGEIGCGDDLDSAIAAALAALSEQERG